MPFYVLRVSCANERTIDTMQHTGANASRREDNFMPWAPRAHWSQVPR